MSKLPITWMECLIGDVTKIVAGGTPPSKDASNFTTDNSGIAWVTPADLSRFKEIYISRGARNLTEKGFRISSAVKMPMGSVLFSSRAPIGYVAIAANEITTNQGFKSFVLPCELNNHYIYYYLKYIKPVAEAMATGTTFKELSGSGIAKLSLVVAPLNEQKRIADKLDAILARVDACRERLDRIPGILKRFRQAVLAAATSGKLTEDWRNINNRNMLQWAQLTIGQLITGIEAGLNVQCIERPPKADEQGLVKISAVTWGRYNDAESKTLPLGKDVPEATRIRKGDFLISRANTLELVGACVIVDNVLRPVFLSDKILRLVMPGHIKSWLLYTLRSPAGRRQIETLASGNQLSMRNLSQASLRSITIPMPPDDERKVIIRRIESLFAYADRLEARYAAARIQVDKLIPATLAKAFRGELVPRDPDDVPANVLLERIRAASGSPETKRGRSKSVNSATGS